MAAIRLNKFLAHATGISRREADSLIDQGRVTINGTQAELGRPVQDDDIVHLDGKQLSLRSYTYLVFHKPVGYVCSRKRQGDTPTIYELLPEQYRILKPVGRLDKDSSGILLLTDDGDFAHSMTHPSFHKTKRYEVELDKDLQPLHHQMISDYGVNLEDGPSKLQLTKAANAKEWVVEMHEGRNRQIRRTFDALGYTVTKLHRTNFGPYQLDTLSPGKFTVTQK